VTLEVDPMILSCVPQRLADWRAGEDGIVVVERTKPATRGLCGFLDRVKWLMIHPRIRLDAMGSAVWQRMDSGATLGEIAVAVAAEFPDRADEMAERAALFATALHHQGLVELRILEGD
jgi:hypothetical protein